MLFIFTHNRCSTASYTIGKASQQFFSPKAKKIHVALPPTPLVRNIAGARALRTLSPDIAFSNFLQTRNYGKNRFRLVIFYELNLFASWCI